MITIHPCGFGRMLAGSSVRCSACVKNPMGRALTLTPPRLGEVTLPATFFLSKKKNQYHPKFLQFSLLTHPQSNTMDLSKPQFGASSSSSSSSTHSFTHDVFLSFSGDDTRNNFTGHLHSKLVDKGFETFIDDGLPKGKDMWQELLEVIKGSKISVVVFSAKFASSDWCLDELVKMIECKESKHQIVYPIFYKIDPSDIRYQKGQIGKGIAHLSEYKENLEKVGDWKEALTKAANLSGWHIPDGGHEANAIDEIVKQISTEIMKCTPLDVATYPVGIESRVKDILEYLNVGQDNPHMVGIWGIGGIGKSTLAKAVYNLISHEFEHSCFLKIDSFSQGGLVQLQNDFLSKIIERIAPKWTNVDEGITLLKQKLSQKRVLLVIDNVNHLDQLRALAGGCDWFGPSSRIIITTRERDLLNAHGVDFDSIYEVKELNPEDASKLFNFYAFKGSICTVDFLKLATEVLHYAKGIPLVLEVLGSDLCRKDKDEWKDALDYYRRYPNQKIQRTLQRSYDVLDDQIQQVFLHIACFFKGDKQSYVLNVLQSCDLNPMYSLKVLVEKALIKIVKDGDNDNEIWMHDLLEDMGREIVRQESPDEKEQRSRLWLYEDVREVLEENTGTEKIKGIMVRCDDSQPIKLNAGSFTNLKNLQIFIVDDDDDDDDDDLMSRGIYKSNLEMLCGDGVDLDYLPNQLRVLVWMHCSLRSLPTNFNPTKLGILHVGGSCMTPLVNERLKNLRYLISVKLSGCDGLTRIPDLSGLTSLECLKLSWCRDLVEVDPSVGRLEKLVYLELTHCEKLQMFQERINLKSLETLVLYQCPLKFFPEIEADMKSLNRLDLKHTDIKELPCSVANLTGLKSLSLFGCDNLTNVPSSIFYGMQRLEDLDLQDCIRLVTFPTKSESLPPRVFSTNLPSKLQVHLNGCNGLKEISEFPLEIDGLFIGTCGSFERISKLSKILEGKDSKMFGELDLSGCRRLCDNLACGVISEVEVEKKRKKPEADEGMREADKLTALLALFFSCPKSEEFQVRFPARAPLPNWLTCRQDVNWYVNGLLIQKEHEFCIEIPQNSNWDNKGLALCIQSCFLRATDHFVYINGIKFDEKRLFEDEVWVHYIPFVTVIRRLIECGMPPPNMFRVMFRLTENFIERGMHLGGSWGVHLIEDLEAEGR